MRKSIYLCLYVLIALCATAAGQRPIQKPKDTWQKPGEIQKPSGTWQKPGEIQTPKGIEAIKVEEGSCQQRLTVGADALFEFNKASLNPQAEETLEALGPLILKAGAHPVRVEGHTDAIGSIVYNQTLSEQRAQTVKGWLVGRQYVPDSTPIRGFGKSRPVASNTNPDGSDNPEGRQQNRRVEVVIDTCK
jgi:outer membrane protein OmpA-like peptidoglycan-associated protein